MVLTFIFYSMDSLQTDNARRLSLFEFKVVYISFLASENLGTWYDLKLFLFLFLIQFNVPSLSRLFHSYQDKPIGRWGETGVPLENLLTCPHAELGLSHMWPVGGFEPTSSVTAVR